MGLFGQEPKFEYCRTCNRCGVQWYVTPADKRQAADASNKWLQRGQRMQIAGERMQSMGVPFSAKHDVRVGTLQAKMGQQQQALERTRCPSCGSSSYSEETVSIST